MNCFQIFLRCLTAVFVLLWLLGCATPKKSPPGSPVTVPEHWKATNLKSPMTPAGWLSSFHDPKLNFIVGSVVADNFDLKAAAARLEGVIAQSHVTSADLYPQLGAGGGAAATDTPIYNAKSFQYQFDPHNWNYALNLRLGWEADIWGRLRGLSQAGKADTAAAEFTYEGARLSLAGEAAKAWFAVLESREQIHIAEETLESLRKTYELAKTRYDNGAVSSFDVSLSASDATTAEVNLVQRRENYEEARRSLETLLGHYPSAELDSDHAGMPPLATSVPAGLPSELLLRRPDLRAADWNLFASENRVFSAKAERFPRIALTSTAGTPSILLQNITSDQSFLYTVAANLTQPIFDGGRITWNIKLNKAQRDAAAAVYAQQVLVAFREVENALSNEQALLTSEQLQEKALGELSSAYRIAEIRYKAGQIDIVSFLQAQRSMLNQESVLANTHLQRLTNRINLYLALGETYGTKSPASLFRDSALTLPLPKASS
jgi:NodT family efflux transporter outer membrane factor (OMF) lipoprotein